MGEGQDHPAGTSRLLIRSPAGGEDLRLEVSTAWDVGRLKAELQAVYPGQPAVGRQKLIYGGQVLSDRKPVREIVEGQVESETPATLHLIVREAGGPPSPAPSPARSPGRPREAEAGPSTAAPGPSPARAPVARGGAGAAAGAPRQASSSHGSPPPPPQPPPSPEPLRAQPVRAGAAPPGGGGPPGGANVRFVQPVVYVHPVHYYYHAPPPGAASPQMPGATAHARYLHSPAPYPLPYPPPYRYPGGPAPGPAGPPSAPPPGPAPADGARPPPRGGRGAAANAPHGGVERPPARPRVRLRLDLKLVFKLAMFVMMVNQGGSRLRLALLIAFSVLIYLQQVGAFNSLPRMIPRIPLGAGGGNGQGAPRSFVSEVGLAVLAFFASLVPSWNSNEEGRNMRQDIAAVAAANPGQQGPAGPPERRREEGGPGHEHQD